MNNITKAEIRILDNKIFVPESSSLQNNEKKYTKTKEDKHIIGKHDKI